jgi:hypothetical protein
VSFYVSVCGVFVHHRHHLRRHVERTEYLYTEATAPVSVHLRLNYTFIQLSRDSIIVLYLHSA